ncbi:hypothetical protein EDD29_0427 [Actinocorallia herbida]|uniref:Uncharacterized protein n=1 Tax=Actinocorallia herbida TaxID=58109 RepID=A0A3N1CNQ1_9ACTN|nr:hypothetical protein [Actinocorallia herbida]ROO82940.1 hypothetical protein EDD29_0427 [Actinocorallia herbida]
MSRSAHNPSVLEALAYLRLRFPATTIWFGNHTRSFWALTETGFIEAPTPVALVQALQRTFPTRGTAPVPRLRPYARPPHRRPIAA